MPSTESFIGLPENGRSSVTNATNYCAPKCCTLVKKPPSTFSEDTFMSEDEPSNRVPNAPKSCIGEIFSSDIHNGSSMRTGAVPARPRVVRDTPTRPRDTHSRLFGQAQSSPVVPMVTDTIRSNIQFGDAMANGHAGHNGHSPAVTPTKLMMNGHGSAASTPSRGEVDSSDHLCMPPKRNPVTGDGMPASPTRRRCPGGRLRECNPITGAYDTHGDSNAASSVHRKSYLARDGILPAGLTTRLW